VTSLLAHGHCAEDLHEEKPIAIALVSNIIGFLDESNRIGPMTLPMPDSAPQVHLAVLQQFRVIYGTMRQYFREVEEHCGLSGSQMWVLQEVQRSPGIGVTELAARLAIHQSTCSQLVEKLAARRCLVKTRKQEDHRRLGLHLAPDGAKAIAALPGSAEGALPEALAAIPEVALKTLHINLSELILHLPGRDDAFASMPLAEMVRNVP